MRTPTINDHIYNFIWIKIEKVFEALHDYETVLPVIKPIMDLAGMNIDGCGHFKQPSDFLFIGMFHSFLFCVYISIVLFYRDLGFLIKA
jgi:hypothetical protein